MLVSLAAGLGLAAACGFRVFVPQLALSFAARSGYVPLSSGFDWIASDAAIAVFGSATMLEVVAYWRSSCRLSPSWWRSSSRGSSSGWPAASFADRHRPRRLGNRQGV